MQTIKIGVDVGNYDTKTQQCTIVSGYKKYDKKPEIATKVLFYKGEYYVPDIKVRMPYVADKTKNDQCLILTLFGIAEEMLALAKAENPNAIQEELNKYDHIKLGIGLPPGHYNALAKTTLNYYNEKLSGAVEFEYRKYKFSFEVEKIMLFPQDFVAVYKNKDCNIAMKNTKGYYIVGIGGGTVDVVPVVDGQPDVNGCFSLEMGTRVMYGKIISDIQRNTGENLDESLVEDVIRGEDTVLPQDIKDIIIRDSKQHFENIINGCIQQGVKLSLYPVVFFGGGCLLLKDLINESTRIKSEIIEDVHANAKAYAACLK